MSLLADDPTGYAGAGHLIQHLTFPTLQERVQRVGGTAEMERNSDAVVYTVTGPAAELEYLAEALRGVLEPSPASEVDLLIAHNGLAEERRAEWETARGHLRAALRGRLFPQDLSAAGTDASAARLTAEVLSSVWKRMYRPDRISVVAVGDVTPAAVRAQFAGLPERATLPNPPEAADTASTNPLASAEATVPSVGVAYSASDVDPAALSVTAVLLRRALQRRLPEATVEVEHWWTHFGQGLAILASAPPREMPAVRRAVGTALLDLETSLSPDKVSDAVAGLRREFLFFSRTPDNMAKLIGQFADRTGEPDAAQQFYSRLDTVDETRLRALLSDLAGRTPMRVDVAAQKLPKSE